MTIMATLREKTTPIGKSIRYVLSATHTAAKNRLMVYSPTLASGNKVKDIQSVTFSSATTDVDGKPMSALYSAQVVFTTVKGGNSADGDFVIACLRDFVASEEVERVVNVQLMPTEKLA